ncbi:LPS-assembly protein LptD [Thermodesulfobacteriota bacterium]
MRLFKPQYQWSAFPDSRTHPMLAYPVMLRMMLFFVLVLLINISALPVFAISQVPEHLFRDDPNIPWHISADKIHRDLKNNRYSAVGNVVITKGDRTLTADSVLFDHQAMKATATGHVVMTVGKDVVRGSKIEIDLNAESGTIYDGMLFIAENHFYISGSKIEKTGKDTYTADKASISTCDGDSPAWKITGRQLNITIEGYGTVKHAALWAKRIPVLYTPYLAFPVKLKRQSGFLPPQFGISERKGAEYIQPYFWAISENTDATFYYHHMQERGEKVGAEYRYILNDLSQGTAMYDYLYDRRIDDGTGDSSTQWGYLGDNVLRPNNDRYWFRMKHDQKLPYHFSGKLDLDIVSDQDYLTEFRTGYTGFEDTNDYFIETFGRSLDDYTDPIRVNRLNFNRIWSSFSLNAETRWNDNVVARRQEETDTTLQELPFIGFDASKQQVADSPFFFDLNSSYTHFYRQNGNRGNRGDVYPRFYLPYRVKHYFTIEPSAGTRGTAWYINSYDASEAKDDRSFSRGIYDLRLDLTSDIYSIFDLQDRNIDKIKHTLRPQVLYEYIPHQDQDNLPSFDGIDRIGKKNLISYSLTNIFTSRSIKSNKPPETAGHNAEPDPPDHTYHQFSRLKLEQSYDINKENDNDLEPFSPVFAEFDFVYSKYFSLTSDAGWSTYDTDFVSRNIAAKISDRRGDSLFLEHRYTRGESESIYADLLVNINRYLSGYTSYERNILDGNTIESSLGAIYKAQCWSLNVRYVDEESDRKFEFIISLHGLGEAGTSMAGRTVETPFK